MQCILGPDMRKLHVSTGVQACLEAVIDSVLLRCIALGDQTITAIGEDMNRSRGSSREIFSHVSEKRIV